METGVKQGDIEMFGAVLKEIRGHDSLRKLMDSILMEKRGDLRKRFSSQFQCTRLKGKRSKMVHQKKKKKK